LAGTSEHQAGLAVDLKVISKSGKAYSLVSGNVYYQRLAENAKNR
jgi:LAS superfamily LD-carboxypeptidase LdcB